jgi:hypothetical protein
MISTRSVGLLIDTVVCLTLAKWETVSGRFGGYLTFASPVRNSMPRACLWVSRVKRWPSAPASAATAFGNGRPRATSSQGRCILTSSAWSTCLGVRVRGSAAMGSICSAPPSTPNDSEGVHVPNGPGYTQRSLTRCFRVY